MARDSNLRLSSLVIAAVLLIWGFAMAMAPSAPDKLTTNDQARSPLLLVAARCTAESTSCAFSKPTVNEVVIPHGCPYNLDKVCKRNRRGKLVHCHCAS
jgi:hypothetical protein